MRHPLICSRLSICTAAFAGAGFLAMGGCVPNGNSIPPGAYSGVVPCILDVIPPTGETGQEPFVENLSVVADPLGALAINGVAVEIGSSHTRSLPTAELSFEVVGIQRAPGSVQVTYSPGPTLPGIEINGSLVETYDSRENGLAVSAEADLTITNIDGITTLSIDCETTLGLDLAP